MENSPEEQDKPKANPQKKVVGLLLMEAGFEFAFLIAVPLVAGILAGKWLDNKYHHNFFVIIGILLGLTVSGMSIYKRILDYKNLLDKRINK